MTTSIPPPSLRVDARHGLVRAPVAEQKAPELPPIDPATTAKLGQAQVFLDNVRQAWAKQSQAAVRYTAQLVASQRFGQATSAQLGLRVSPSTLVPHPSEVVVHPEVLEELKKYRERESRLAEALGDAIDGTERPTNELLRALGVLDLGHTREEGTDKDESLPINPEALDASGLIWNSHSEFYEQIGLLLAALKQNWLSKYQDAMKTFLKFYEEFQDILELLKVEGSGDKGDVKLYTNDVVSQLDSLMARYGRDDHALATFSTRAEAQAFIDNLGLPGMEPSESSKGGWAVKINTKAVEDLHKSLPENEYDKHGNEIPTKWDSAKYNAWVSNKDGNVEQIKHMSKVLGEKLSETTQQFDNIVKILSSTIDKITDADMSFVNGL